MLVFYVQGLSKVEVRSMRFTARGVLFLTGALAALAPNAHADLLTYQFSGLVNKSEAAGIPVGSAISVTLLYDNAAPSTGFGPNYADFKSTAGQIQATAGAASFQTSATLDMRSAHSVNFIGWPGVPDADYDLLDILGVDISRHLLVFMYLLDPHESVFASSRDLPAELPMPEFETIYFQAYEVEGGSGKRITGLLAAVPEPSGVLILLAIVVWGAVALRRKKSHV